MDWDLAERTHFSLFFFFFGIFFVVVAGGVGSLCFHRKTSNFRYVFTGYSNSKNL